MKLTRARLAHTSLAVTALAAFAGAQLAEPAQHPFDLKPPGPAYSKAPGGAAAPSKNAALAPRAKDGAPAGLQLAAGRPDHARMYYTDSGDSVWARGATYKARIDSEGIEYTPLFGASAPANYPLELDLASVTIAGDPL